MASLQELGLEIYLFILCINAGILIVDASIDTPLLTPFDGSTTVTGIASGVVTDTANFTDPSQTTLLTNLTGNQLSNSTLGGPESEVNTPFDFVIFPLALAWSFIQFITGGFLFQVLALFAFPPIFIFSLQAIIGILLARLVLYYVWGR